MEASRPLGTEETMPSDEQRAHSRRRNDETLLYGGDRPEADRLAMEDGLLKLSIRRLFYAPVSDPATILDVPGGIGLWALELLQRFPDAHVTALDETTSLFKHFFATTRAKPFYPMMERLRFEQARLTRPLPFESATFAFTHAHLSHLLLSEEHWTRLLQELTRVTQADGWVELLVAGPCFTKHPSDICATLLDARTRLYQAANFAPTAEADFTHLLALAGITQVARHTHLIGKASPTARMLLARDMRHLLWNTKDLLDRYQILPGEQFGSALSLFQDEAQRAGLLMPLFRCWFQPQ
jgi:ubiquinone/menaquinone biosynthesis C-methylase UbiE